MDLGGVVRLFNFNAKKKNQRSKVIRGMIDDVGPPGAYAQGKLKGEMAIFGTCMHNNR